MPDQVRLCIGFFWLMASTVASAQTCNLPVPFLYEFQNNVTALLSAANAGDPCALSVALNSGAGPTGAGFLHYRRPTPATTVRYGFRMDISALGALTLANRSAMIFSASSPAVIYGESHLLDIYLAGSAANPVLHFVAATEFIFPFMEQTVALAQTSNVVRVEIDVGDATKAGVYYWINHSFSDPEDGFIATGSNESYLGVVVAEIGLSSPSSAFLTDYSGSPIVFDQIESSDDVLFYDDFSSGAQQ